MKTRTFLIVLIIIVLSAYDAVSFETKQNENSNICQNLPNLSSSIKLRSDIQKFADNILGWFDLSDGAFHDPYETYYGEGYGPGVASVVFAHTYNFTGNEKYLKGAVKAINRSFALIDEPEEGHSKFTDLFLKYWSLIGYDGIRDQVSPSLKVKWEKQFSQLPVDFAPSNINGEAMLLSYMINLHLFGIRNADKMILDSHLKQIEAAQNDFGFIDDAFDQDAKPIAYHLFTASLLGHTLALFNKYSHISNDHDMLDMIHFRDRIESVVGKAVRWMDHFTASDGSFTMAERSRDQFWTCGSFVFLQGLRGESICNSSIRSHLEWWFRFLKQDGTISITPNYFPNSWRVGFESYSVMTMYDTLGFALLSLFDEVESKDLCIKGLPGAGSFNDDLFIDQDAGYLHWRSGASSVGVSLRRHSGGYFGGYSPALSIMNLSLNMSRFRPIPNPNYRISESFHGLYEGFRACKSKIARPKAKLPKDRTYGPDLTKNADISYKSDKIHFAMEYRDFGLKKSVALNGNSLTVCYRFNLTNSLGSLYIEIPILISDGKNETDYTIRKNKVTIDINKEQYVLICNEGYKWQIDKHVSLLSSSGISRVLYIVVGHNLKKGDVKEVSWTLKRVR